MNGDDPDRSAMALGCAFAASTLVFAITYAIGKSALRDVPAAFIIALSISLVALRLVYLQCGGEHRTL